MLHARFLLPIALAGAATVLAGCRTSQRASAPGIGSPDQLHLEALTRSQYEVLGRVDGEGCAEYYGLWPLPIFWIRSDGQAGEPRSKVLFGFGVRRRAARSAQFKALASQEDADFILYPRHRDTTTSKGIWYRKTCARVEGKAIRLRLDDELSDDERLERPRTTDAIVR